MSNLRSLVLIVDAFKASVLQHKRYTQGQSDGVNPYVRWRATAEQDKMLK